MIQRIQSVFLLLVIASLITFLFIPLWVKSDVQSGEAHEMHALFYKGTTGEVVNPQLVYMPYMIVGILAVAAITIAIIQLFKFKDRVLQMKIGVLNSFFIVSTLGSAGFFWYTLGRELLPQQPISLGFGLVLPAFAMIFNRIALRFIKKDEDLVRSVDRIR